MLGCFLIEIWLLIEIWFLIEKAGRRSLGG